MRQASIHLSLHSPGLHPHEHLQKLHFVNQICELATFQRIERYAASETEKCSR